MTDPPDEDVYDLSEDDALPPGSPPAPGSPPGSPPGNPPGNLKPASEPDIYELRDEDVFDDEPTEAARVEIDENSLGHTADSGELSGDYSGGDYSGGGDSGGGEVCDSPPRGDLEILVHPARYCKACGFDLTLIQVSPCPGCEKQFDPDDDSTTRDTPLPTQENYWLQKPRLAGYALLALFIVGRGVMGFTADNLGGRFAEIVLGLAVLFLLVPWACLGVFLLLEALDEHHNPKLVVAVPLGFAAGLLLTLGTHPGLMLAAGIAGGFAGFIRGWREA